MITDERSGFETTSGIRIEPVYGPAEHRVDYEADLGAPGAFPFTRGVYPRMYRERPWTMRQYAGFGTADDTNRRFRYLLESGQTGLSVAFDLPTQMGLDSDDPRSDGEVGRVGVAIDTVEDLKRLFTAIPLERVSTSMTINATAAILVAMYVTIADERGIGRNALRGTVQNDILKEFVSRGTYIYPVASSLRLVTDVLAFCAVELPLWNSISVSGYHMREAGATAAQEIAFTLANARAYVRDAIARGLDLEHFAPRLSFFFAAHSHLFEEIAKFRAARRLWARLMRDEFGASDRSCRLRFHTQTAGSTLTAQQPMNNVVRVATQALSAVLGGTQSLHTNGFDEALRLPSAEAAHLALRTQQVLATESGVCDTVDPLAGSYYVEALTTRLESLARAYLEHIDEIGDPKDAVTYMADEIHRAAYRSQLELERGRRSVVGVNAYVDDEDAIKAETPDFERLAAEQRRRLADVRAARDDAVAERALRAVATAADSGDNLLPPMIEAVRVRATLGEVSGCLRARWGTYQPA